MAKKREIERKKCPICKKEKSIRTGFYKSSSPLFSLDECVPNGIVNDDGTINLKKLKSMMQKLDKPLYYDYLDSAYNQYRIEHGYLTDDEVAKRGKDILGIFFKNINSLRQNANKNFSDSEKDGFIHQTSNKPVSEKEKITRKYIEEAAKN